MKKISVISIKYYFVILTYNNTMHNIKCLLIINIRILLITFDLVLYKIRNFLRKQFKFYICLKLKNDIVVLKIKIIYEIKLLFDDIRCFELCHYQFKYNMIFRYTIGVHFQIKTHKIHDEFKHSILIYFYSDIMN